MNTTNFLNIKKKELLDLPVRKWDDVKSYDSIIVCPTAKRHESGYRLMAIIGCVSLEPIEIAAYCDDLNFLIFDKVEPDYYPSPFRADMILSNCIHFHSNHYRFQVGLSLSSTDIAIIKQ
jgi:hypothetical protein